MVKTMKIKKALAGVLLSVSLAGGIFAPVSVTFATDEVTSVAPAVEAVTEAPAAEVPAAEPVVTEAPAPVVAAEFAPASVAVNEAATKYDIYISYLEVETNYPVSEGFSNIGISPGVYTYNSVSIESFEYAGFYKIDGKLYYGDIASVDTSKAAEPWISVSFYYRKSTTPPTTEVVAPVYRLYQPDLKVHLYTKDTNEYKVLATRGWKQEGISWRTETQKGDAVYRLYHPDLKVHLYTKDTNENKVLATRGWKQEGVAYRSFGSVPVYRLYHAGIRKHLYTKDANEYKVLATRGWLQEGVAWYSQP